MIDIDYFDWYLSEKHADFPHRILVTPADEDHHELEMEIRAAKRNDELISYIIYATMNSPSRVLLRFKSEKQAIMMKLRYDRG